MDSPPYQDLGFAKIDLDRLPRRGVPEIIFCEGKSPEQVVKILALLSKPDSNQKNSQLSNPSFGLATRAQKKHWEAVRKALPQAKYYPEACIIYLGPPFPKQSASTQNLVAVLCAGTSDLPIAEEAALTTEILGNPVRRIYDVGVAGLQRLISHLDEIRKAQVVIVVAGMDGALPSVVSGLVSVPVIAVPTSIGYGANFGGLAALLAMLNSCSPGLSIVNIDNGFGAGYQASLICNGKNKIK